MNRIKSLVLLASVFSQQAAAEPQEGWYQEASDPGLEALISTEGGVKTVEFYDDDQPHKPRSARYELVATSRYEGSLEKGVFKLHVDGPTALEPVAYVEPYSMRERLIITLADGRVLEFELPFPNSSL